MKSNMTTTQDINATARLIDFTSSFQMDFSTLQKIFGISNVIKSTPGTRLKTLYANVELENSVAEGETIPLSQATVLEKFYGEITIEKHAKGVTLEAIQTYGFDAAVGKTDERMRYMLYRRILNKFFAFIKTGMLTSAKTDFQEAVSEAIGRVENKWSKMDLGTSGIVCFVNILDVRDYLGKHGIYNVEQEIGLSYLQNFLGATSMILVNDELLPRGTVIATSMDNLLAYHLDAADPQLKEAGLVYYTDDDLHLVGAAIVPDYSTGSTTLYTIYGIDLLAEYIDGIAVVNFGKSMATLTASSSAGTTSGTKLTITAPTSIPEDWIFYFASQATTAPTAPDYLDPVPNGFTRVTFVDGVADNIVASNGHKGTLIATNSVGQVVAASGSINVTA